MSIWHVLRENSVLVKWPFLEMSCETYILHGVFDASRCMMPQLRWEVCRPNLTRMSWGVWGGELLNLRLIARKPAQGLLKYTLSDVGSGIKTIIKDCWWHRFMIWLVFYWYDLHCVKIISFSKIVFLTYWPCMDFNLIKMISNLSIYFPTGH